MDLLNVTDPKYEGFPFGAGEPAKIAAALRKMADGVESGRVCIQQMRLIQRTTQEDFYQQSLIVRFVERV